MNNKHKLQTTKSFRLTSSLAHSIEATARGLNLSEGAFMRKVIEHAIDQIHQN